MDRTSFEDKQCPVCRKCFDRKDTLRRHLQIHDSNRPPRKQRKRACVACFRSKIRCQGERPSCSACLKRNLSCKYDHDPGVSGQSPAQSQYDRLPGSSPPLNSTLQNQYESSDSNHLLSPQQLQPQSSHHPLNFLSFPLESHADSNIYAPYADPDLLSGFEWIFNTGFDDGLPYISRPDGIIAASPSRSAEISEQASRQVVAGAQPREELESQQPFDQTVALTPTEEHHRENRGAPEDRWPMEWHAVPVQLLSLPHLSRDKNLPLRVRHFNIPTITPSTKAHLLNTIQMPMQRSPWQTVSLADFPTEEMLDHCVDLYFVHFDKNVPIIHRPTFDPAKDPILTLAIASIGACYTGLEGATAFSNALSELTRRLLFFVAEYDPRFVRTGTYLSAQLLQSIHGFSGGNKRLYELSESGRSVLINNARNMGLFEMHRFGDRIPPNANTLELQWEAWIYSERLLRIAWALYMHDASSTYTRNSRPYISLMEIRAMHLPCSADHWESESPEAWVALHPWSSSMPASPRLSEALDKIFQGDDISQHGTHDDYQLHILGATAVRLMWSTMELEFAAAGPLVNSPEGLSIRKQTIYQAARRFMTPLKQNSQTLRREGFEAAVQRSCLAQFADVLGIDDIVNYTHLVWRCGPASEPARRLLAKWAIENPHKVRRITRASAYVLSAIRQFPYNHHLEPYHVFHCGFLIWTMTPLLRSLPRVVLSDAHRASFQTHRQPDHPNVVQLDWLGSDDAPEGQKIMQWLENGGPCVLRMHAIPDVLSDDGSRKVLLLTADMLKRMPVWGIAKVFRNAVLRAIQSREE